MGYSAVQLYCCKLWHLGSQISEQVLQVEVDNLSKDKKIFEVVPSLLHITSTLDFA